ncbi:MAG: sigma-54-dependent Fis family transcriptional regulator [Planctomycetes bacterium]|nr:sigma-54-dependent Fis family transcriptional regulator [Planctomycetota bacterium]
MRRILSVILRDAGHSVAEAAGVREAERALKADVYDLVITDQKMGDGEGLDLLKSVVASDPSVPVIMMTAFASVDLAVRAMRQGAFDFITKPFQPEVISAAVVRALEHGGLLRENLRLKEEIGDAESQLVGGSAAIKTVREQIAKVAPTSVTILITGETGTGKELIARAIHARSPRARGPFIAVNCASLQESLLESELFGHEKGAFTGADKARRGLFEAADGGTLFLDEAGEMSLALQAKLLRVLMDQQVTRVGATASNKVDVRVLFATHRDLKQRVAEGLFREDLFYRVNVVPIHIAALREHRDDIPALVNHLMTAVARDLKLPPRKISDAAVAKLQGYGFPGNVRELRNLIERAYVLSSGVEIGPEDFLLGNSAPATGNLASVPHRVDLRQTLGDFEIALIKRALADASGVQAEAARLLGLSRSDLAYKLKKFGLAE